MTMRAILTIVVLVAAGECSHGQIEYVACTSSNAVWSLQAEVVLPEFPNAEHFTWHFRPVDSTSTFCLSGLPMFLPGTHSRQKEWRLSFVPKETAFHYSNLVYQATWQVTTFANGSTSTNSTVLTMPLGQDFSLTNVDNLVVDGKWIRLKPERGEAPVPSAPSTGPSSGTAPTDCVTTAEAPQMLTIFKTRLP